MQEHMAALSQALLASQQHTAELSKQLDVLRGDSIKAMQTSEAQKMALEGTINVLRAESSEAVTTLRRQLLELQASRGGVGPHRDRSSNLINLKSFEPTPFAGKETDDIKPWAKRIRNYCNAKQSGFRTALEWAELQKDDISTEDMQRMDWEPAVRADVELYEFLQMVTTHEA